MVEYTDLDNLRTHRYHYDCFGRRVAKVVDHGLSTAKTTRFIYGGQASWQVLAEFDGFQPGTNVPATASYAFGNYIDEPIQTRRDFDGVGPQTTKDFYYHQDELFNVVAITAGQNGTTLPRHAGVYNTGDIIERIKYGDYGSPTVMQGASGTIAFTSLLGNRFTFTGREYDGETQFSYYRTRYLEHEWGRFTTRDTIGTWGDASNMGNGMTYVMNNAVSRVDPFGLHGGDDEAQRWEDSGYNDYIEQYLPFWLEWLGAKETDAEGSKTPVSQGCKDRLKCILRAISEVESRHGTGAGNQPTRDPMQSGNPADACHRSLTGPIDEPGPRREGDRPGVEHYDDLPDSIKKSPGVPHPFNSPKYTIPKDGHNSPSWSPQDSFFWGIPWYLKKTNQDGKTSGRRGAWNLGDCSMKRLIDGAVNYNGGGDPDYRNKIEKALKASGCNK